jgi:hypothetical protein
MGRVRNRLQPKKFSCPHCDKSFQVEKGRDYHVDHYVCRSSERPGGPVVKGRRKVVVKLGSDDIPSSSSVVPDTKHTIEENDKGVLQPDEQANRIDTDAATSLPPIELCNNNITNVSSSKKTIYKKIRGSLKDRTCPTCQAVFTSVNGREYHCSKIL